MANRSQSFDPKQAPPTVGGDVLSGFSQNSIRLTMDSPLSVDEIGADGEMVDVLQNDFRGVIEIFLTQTSRSNQILSNLYNARRTTGLGKFPFLWEDPLGNDKIVAPICWIDNIPPVTRGKTVSEMVWRIRASNIIVNLGGSDQAVA